MHQHPQSRGGRTSQGRRPLYTPKASRTSRCTAGVVRESGEGERRAALVPKVTGKFLAQGINIVVEENAGQGALISGEQNLEAGATVGDAWSADVVVSYPRRRGLCAPRRAVQVFDGSDCRGFGRTVLR